MNQKAFLRIDDFPYTSEMYLGYGSFRDSWALNRFQRIVDACVRYSVTPEFMVCSHVDMLNGDVVRLDVAMPKTVQAMQKNHADGLICVNLHGMTHVNPKASDPHGVSDAHEFLGLDEQETRFHISSVAAFVQEVFGKKATGFVAPVWSYEPGVTKKVAAEFVQYIADSYDHAAQGKCLPFGTVDPEFGYVHFPETIRYGKKTIEFIDVSRWESMIESDAPMHMMYHGYRIPGEWRTFVKEVTSPLRMGLCLRGSLVEVLRSAHRAGVEWSTLEAEARRILNSESRVQNHELKRQGPNA